MIVVDSIYNTKNYNMGTVHKLKKESLTTVENSDKSTLKYMKQSYRSILGFAEFSVKDEEKQLKQLYVLYFYCSI